MMALRNYDAWRTREPEPYNGIGNWRLVNAGIRAGIIKRLFGLGINRELETAHQEALAAWQCNVTVERELTAFADTLRAATAPERVAAA